MIELARNLANDRAALSKLEMRESATAYTINHGVGYRLQQIHLEAMKRRPFSLNIDEAMSKSHKKVLSIIACYIDDDGKSNILHIFSVEVSILHLFASSIIKFLFEFWFTSFDDFK